MQDGAAHRDLWKCKGDSGSRFCMGCLTLSPRAIADWGHQDPMLGRTPLRDDQVTFCTDEEVIDAVKRLDAFRLVDSAARFEKRSQVLGFTWSPYSLLTDPCLTGVIRPCSQLMHDWMHGLFSNGVFNILLHNILDALEQEGLRDLYPFLSGFVAQWTLPRRICASDLARTFDPARRKGNRDGGAFRCQASEGLSLYPLLCFWIQSMVLPEDIATLACRAFVCFCHLADCCMAAMRGVCADTVMRPDVHAFLAQFDAAFGSDIMSQKFHWLVHYARELNHHGFLLSCFVHERNHKTVRRYATPMLNTRDFERTLIREVVSHGIRVLEDEDALDSSVGLVRPRRPGKRLRRTLHELLCHAESQELLVASECRFNAYDTCHVRDVVFIREDSGGFFLGEVFLHVQSGGLLLTGVSSYKRIALDRATRTAQWEATGEQQLVSSIDILSVAVWLSLSPGNVRTLVPTDLM